MPFQQDRIKKEIIDIGRKLYTLRLVAGRIGNLSARLDNDNILITARGSCLGRLKSKDIIKVNLAEDVNPKTKPVSSEFPIHRLIYKNFKAKTIIHCHPPLTNAYFSIYSYLKAQTPEIKFYLGDIQAVEQNTLTITRPKRIIKVLKKHNLVVIKNHGLICMAQTFYKGLNLIEILEEAIKTAAITRLFKKKIIDKLDNELKKTLIL